MSRRIETGGGDAPLSPEAIAHLNAEVDAGGSIGPDDVERAAAAYPAGGGDAGVRKDFYEAALRDAYREGAEAMREAGAQFVYDMLDVRGLDSLGIELKRHMLALPIPGSKTDADPSR